MSKKHVVIFLLMSFIGGFAGSAILSVLQPKEASAKQTPKEISVNKILFYDEAGNLKGEIKGYKGGIGVAATNGSTNKEVWIELNSIEGTVYGGKKDASGVKEVYFVK